MVLCFGQAALHGLSGELGWEDTEALLDGDTVPGELVVWGEACWVSGLGNDALDGLLLERVDTLAVLSLMEKVRIREAVSMAASLGELYFLLLRITPRNG